METTTNLRPGDPIIIGCWIDALTEAIENGDAGAEKRARIWIARHALWQRPELKKEAMTI